MLCDSQRLGRAFRELGLLSAVSKHSDETYTMNEAVADHVRKSLPSELLSFWRYQALALAYRAIPCKYIESA